MEAIQAHQQHDLDKADKINKAIIQIEPRLVEPNLELSTIALRREQYDIAQAYSEEAIRLCQLHGHWMENFSDEELLALAYCNLGESLRKQAEKDEIIFTEPERFKELMKKSKAAYMSAAKIDPNNEHAQYWGGYTKKWESEK